MAKVGHFYMAIDSSVAQRAAAHDARFAASITPLQQSHGDNTPFVAFRVS